MDAAQLAQLLGQDPFEPLPAPPSTWRAAAVAHAPRRRCPLNRAEKQVIMARG